MPQIGESIAIIAGANDKWDCPFSHDPDTEDYENDFVGIGSTLGEKLASGDPTSRNSKYGGDRKRRRELDPRNRPGHALNKSENPRPVKLEWNPGLVHDWPVTCAAHHLVPAQASLKKSDLLPWLVKKGTPAKVKGGGGKNGLVRNNVGYDVNGAHNGVWLPGPYAMRGVWTGFAPTSDAEDEIPADTPAVSTEPAGDPTMTKDAQFEYAVVAMRKGRGQFHDAHPKYSGYVLDALNLIAGAMVVAAAFSNCDECKKKLEKGDIPPPYSLIDRLNSVSRRLRSRLIGGPASWRRFLFTSRRSVAYMRNQNPPLKHN